MRYGLWLIVLFLSVPVLAWADSSDDDWYDDDTGDDDDDDDDDDTVDDDDDDDDNDDSTEDDDNDDNDDDDCGGCSVGSSGTGAALSAVMMAIGILALALGRRSGK